MAQVEISDELLPYVIDAINCISACFEGNRQEVEEIWFIEDDKALTGGTYLAISEELQDLATKLKGIWDDSVKRDPEIQDMLHRYKMWRKYGDGEINGT